MLLRNIIYSHARMPDACKLLLGYYLHPTHADVCDVLFIIIMITLIIIYTHTHAGRHI